MDIFDFTKKHPKPETRETLANKAAGLNVDPDTGASRFRLPGSPGSGAMDLVGVDPKTLRERRDAFLKLRARVAEDMRADWTCTQCRRTFSGRRVRVVVRGGVEALVCPDRECDGPVVRAAAGAAGPGAAVRR